MASGNGPNFRLEDIATFNNKKLIDSVMPEVIGRIIEWGCNKASDETFWNFIVKRHSTNWKVHKKRWAPNEDQVKLQETTCKTFDVTFLVKLFPEVCDKIDLAGTDSWKTDDDSRVESLLQRIKDLRNLIIHDPSRTAISSTVLSEVQELLINLLKAAGNLYVKPPDEVNREIDNVKTLVRRVRETLVNQRQQSIFDVQDKLENDCKLEIRNVWENVVNKEVLPFCKVKVVRSDVFHPITLEIPNEYDEQSVKFSCEKLFQKWPEFDDTVNCIVIEGMAGSGKTTLVKRIAHDYVSDGKVFQGVEKYSLMIHMECRNPNVETLAQVLLRNFPKTLQSLHINEVLSAIQNLRVLLFIDGIDELNEKSRILVDDVLDQFGMKQDSMLIFTSRPSSSKVFRNKLDEKSIDYQTLNIKKISRESEQIQFLDRYQTAIQGINPPQLIKAFRTLNHELQSHFVYPIFLTLFCHLFRESPTDVNAWTSQRNVMEQTLKLCKDKMVQRISVSNAPALASKIIEAICDLSFRCLCWEQMSIDQTTFDEFCNECRDKIDQNIDYYSITSCILLTKCSYYSAEEDSYCFFHRSQQEHLASRSITSRLSRNPRKSVKEALHEIMEPYDFAPEDLRKVVMALKFTILEYDTADKRRRLGNRYLELLELINTAGLSNFEDWAEIVTNFPLCRRVEEIAAAAAAAEDDSAPVVWWEVTNLGQVSAATRMLPHSQPLALKIKLPESWVPPRDGLVALLEAVGRYHSGGLVLELHNHFATFTPADEALLHLHHSS